MMGAPPLLTWLCHRVMFMRSLQLDLALCGLLLLLAACSDAPSSGGKPQDMVSPSDMGGDPDLNSGADLGGSARDMGDEEPVEEPGALPGGDLLTYVDGSADERLHTIVRLSDGTFLAGGEVGSLEVFSAEAPRQELALDGVTSSASGRVAVLLHLSADLQRILRVIHMPAGTVANVKRIRMTSRPGQPTGTLYLSGDRTVDDPSKDGYYLARLEGNLVDGPITGVSWALDISCPPRQASGDQGTSAYKSLQPWDVGSDGKVVYGRGAEYDFRWAIIERLKPDGTRDLVPGWPAHWSASREWSGRPIEDYPDAATDPLLYSGIVMKAGRRGSLRSTSAEAYARLLSDGNGRTDRQGAWPDDYFFSGPCTPDDCPTGRGYTGYRTSDKPTQRVGSIVIDRRDNHIYFGYSTQSRLPDGNPDFEPAVVAMDASGQLKWWSRLYHEQVEQRDGQGNVKVDAQGNTLYHRNSTPDQYVDGLAIDHTNGQLVVLARAHGNNVINLWRGDTIAASPGAKSFQRQFTGNSGNIHISWLGKLALRDGTLRHATYIAEYPNTTDRLGAPLSEPNLDGWPDPNAGWPDVNTTRCRSELAVDLSGRVAVLCTGRRTITTAGAHQKMIKFDQGSSAWNQFVRVYAPELDTLTYSSLVVGQWDPETQQGGGNTWLGGVALVRDGVVFVGHQERDEDGSPRGEPIPTAGVPSWGNDAPSAGEAAILGHFRLD